jgi:hypothetical protein
MSMQFRLPRPLVALRLKKSRGLIAAALMAALILVPTASSGAYTDPSGDSTTAGDLTSVTVAGDKASGQLLFRITGTNIASSETNLLILDIDSDANPLTGDITENGSDYLFGLDNASYSFFHWTGSDWVPTSDLSVQISGNTTQILISVNRSDLGNTSLFNFFAVTVNTTDRAFDSAPDQGAFNYWFDANGPQISSVDVKTTPAGGPKAGKRFVIAPTGLKLPPDRQTTPLPTVLPESYSCTAKLGAKKLASRKGVCSIAIPKKNAKGKKLTVLLTVNYEGATKVVPLTFKVK